MKNLILVAILFATNSALGQRVQVVKLKPADIGQTNQTNATISVAVTPAEPPVSLKEPAVAPEKTAAAGPKGPSKFWSRVGNFMTGGRTAGEALEYGFLGGQGVATSRFSRVPYETHEYESRGNYQSDHYGWSESHSKGSHYTYQKVSQPARGGLPPYVAPTSYVRVESHSSRTFPVYRDHTGGSTTTVKIFGK